MKFAIMALALVIAAPTFAAEVVVVQKDKKFDKTEVRIKKGDTVVFKNEEAAVTHNVFSMGPKNPFELKVQEPGSKSDVTFKEVGTTDVECAIHNNMKLKVIVE